MEVCSVAKQRDLMEWAVASSGEEQGKAIKRGALGKVSSADRIWFK